MLWFVIPSACDTPAQFDLLPQVLRETSKCSGFVIPYACDAHLEFSIDYVLPHHDSSACPFEPLFLRQLSLLFGNKNVSYATQKKVFSKNILFLFSYVTI